MVKKRREREKKSDHMGQRVFRERALSTKIHRVYFELGNHFLFQIWEHINLKRSNHDQKKKKQTTIQYGQKEENKEEKKSDQQVSKSV